MFPILTEVNGVPLVQILNPNPVGVRVVSPRIIDDRDIEIRIEGGGLVSPQIDRPLGDSRKPREVPFQFVTPIIVSVFVRPDVDRLGTGDEGVITRHPVREKRIQKLGVGLIPSELVKINMVNHTLKLCLVETVNLEPSLNH